MLNNVFLKTLFEKRWTILWWFLATLVIVLGVIMIFPGIRDSFGTMLATVPDSMKVWIGEASDWQTLNGYIGKEISGQMVLMTIVFGVVMGAALLAGEEGKGTLQSLLAQPVRRGSVYIQKLVALIVMTIVVMVGMLGGVVLGAVILNEGFDVSKLLMTVAMAGLITLFFAVLTYALGAITGRRGLAGIIVGFYAFVGYFVESLTGMSNVLDKISYAFPFHYYNYPPVMETGIVGWHAAVLAGSVLVFTVIGWLVFRRRDIALR